MLARKSWKWACAKVESELGVREIHSWGTHPITSAWPALVTRRSSLDLSELLLSPFADVVEPSRSRGERHHPITPRLPPHRHADAPMPARYHLRERTCDCVRIRRYEDADDDEQPANAKIPSTHRDVSRQITNRQAKEMPPKLQKSCFNQFADIRVKHNHDSNTFNAKKTKSSAKNAAITQFETNQS